MKQFDFLVIGSGIAGLSFALKVAPHGRVAVITKKGRAESNTNYAQGGIAAVTSKEDSFELHVRDTLEAGAGLCKEAAVRTIVQEGPARIAELIELGMQFTEREIPLSHGARELDLGREGGHSKRRILHAKDITGREIERALLAAVAEQPNITIFENHLAINLITSQKLGYVGDNQCLGVYVLDNQAGQVETFAAPVTVLATGGCGKVYLYTTNPDIATGDGVAMAWRAGAAVANMEFVQFHPTCLYHPKAKSFLISEAVRGEGAVLKSIEGVEFMEHAHPLKSLAPRDIVARAIDSEMKRSGADYVLLDITHKPARFIIDRFPNIYQTCLGYGIDITKEPIPVVPGRPLPMRRRADQRGWRDRDCRPVRRWRSGLHRAARRQPPGQQFAARSNGLRSSRRPTSLAEKPKPADFNIPPWHSGNAHNPDEMVVVSHNWDEIRRIMWDYVGIVRTNKRLQRAQTALPTSRARFRSITGTSLSPVTCWSCATSPRWPRLSSKAPCAAPKAVACTTTWIIPPRTQIGRNAIPSCGRRRKRRPNPKAETRNPKGSPKAEGR